VSASSPDHRDLPLRSDRERTQYSDRDRTYSLRPSEIHALTDVGTFRVVAVEDLFRPDHFIFRSQIDLESNCDRCFCFKNLSKLHKLVQQRVNVLEASMELEHLFHRPVL
jgi:hypothetical protein